MFFINLPLLNKEDFKDRYDLQKFVQMTSNVYDLLDSFFATKVKRLEVFGTTTISGEEHRPDLLSYRLYRDVNFWYILMLYNDYITPLDMKEGDTINYPRIEDLEEVYFQLNALQRNTTITGVL
ncbi:MAG: hypothetical protein WC511_02740 [Candidatus Pacearchaeota archaeon]